MSARGAAGVVVAWPGRVVVRSGAIAAAPEAASAVAAVAAVVAAAAIVPRDRRAGRPSGAGPSCRSPARRNRHTLSRLPNAPFISPPRYSSPDARCGSGPRQGFSRSLCRWFDKAGFHTFTVIRRVSSHIRHRLLPACNGRTADGRPADAPRRLMVVPCCLQRARPKRCRQRRRHHSTSLSGTNGTNGTKAPATPATPAAPAAPALRQGASRGR